MAILTKKDKLELTKEYIRFYNVKALKRFYKIGDITKEEYNSLVTLKHQIK